MSFFFLKWLVHELCVDILNKFLAGRDRKAYLLFPEQTVGNPIHGVNLVDKLSRANSNSYFLILVNQISKINESKYNIWIREHKNVYFGSNYIARSKNVVGQKKYHNVV